VRWDSNLHAASARFHAGEAENSSGDPRFGPGERHADRAIQRHAPELHWPARANVADVVEGEQTF
jgi:hypothetical protein